MQAFRGGDALFLVTDFSTAKTMEKEYQQGKNAVDAAKEVRMQSVPQLLASCDAHPKATKPARGSLHIAW